MKRRNRFHSSHFVSGELYLFHRSEPTCPTQGGLYGIFDKTVRGGVYLESSSEDLQHFRLWHRLPSGYRYSRLANRAELRDFIFNLSCYEYCRENDSCGTSSSEADFLG